jgi:hypothetical protein
VPAIPSCILGAPSAQPHGLMAAVCPARRGSPRWVKRMKAAMAAAQVETQWTLRASIHDHRPMDRERIDPEGYIVSEADLGNVQPEFQDVPKTTAELLLAELGSRLHSGYVYGSVVRATRSHGAPTSMSWRC